MTTALRSRLQFAIHVWTGPEGLLAESDLRQGLLYPFAMCLLDFDPESMNYSCFLGDKSDAVMHFDLMKNNMA